MPRARLCEALAHGKVKLKGRWNECPMTNDQGPKNSQCPNDRGRSRAELGGLGEAMSIGEFQVSHSGVDGGSLTFKSVDPSRMRDGLRGTGGRSRRPRTIRTVRCWSQ